MQLFVLIQSILPQYCKYHFNPLSMWIYIYLHSWTNSKGCKPNCHNDKLDSWIMHICMLAFTKCVCTVVAHIYELLKKCTNGSKIFSFPIFSIFKYDTFFLRETCSQLSSAEWDSKSHLVLTIWISFGYNFCLTFSVILVGERPPVENSK